MIFAALGLPMIDLGWGTQQDRVVIIITSALLFILILSRVFMLMQALQKNQDRLRHDAEHDALTGLGQPGPLLRTHRDGAARAHDGRGRGASSSTSTTSRPSTTRSVTSPATSCWRTSPSGSSTASDPATPWLASAATSSHCCCDRSSTAKTPYRWRDGSSRALAEPIDLPARTVRASASLGIAMAFDDHADVETLMRNADVAMYLSKARGKGRFEFFETEDARRGDGTPRPQGRPAAGARRAGVRPALPADLRSRDAARSCCARPSSAGSIPTAA